MPKAQGFMSLFFKNTQSRFELVGSSFYKGKDLAQCKLMDFFSGLESFGLNPLTLSSSRSKNGLIPPLERITNVACPVFCPYVIYLLGTCCIGAIIKSLL